MSSQVDDAPPAQEVLQHVPLFSRLGARDLKKLAKLCMPRRFAAGETVIAEGAVGLGMFVVTSGRVEVFKGDGEDRVSLGWMGPGDVLGEIALIDDQPRSASALAREETDCLLLTKDSFDLLVRKEPEIAWCIVPSLAERVRELHVKAIEAEEKLRRFEQQSSGAAIVEDDADKDRADDAAGGEKEGTDFGDAVSRVARVQYGLMMGGIKAMTGFGEVWEEFMTTLADEAELAESNSPGAVAERLPDGMISAVRAMLTKMEDVPQEMLDSFRRYSED